MYGQVGGQAAINGDLLTGYETGFVRSEVDGQVSDINRLADHLQGLEAPVDDLALVPEAFDELGAEVVEVEYAPDPHAELAESFYNFFCIRGYARWSEQLDNPETAAQLTDYFREDLERGKKLGAIDYVNCTTKTGKYRDYANRFFREYDLLLTPSTATTAFEVGKLPTTIGGQAGTHARFDFIPFAYMFNLTGNPAATVPCGFDSEGMPVGLQIVGDMKDEMSVLIASVAYEEAHPWAHIRPSV